MISFSQWQRRLIGIPNPPAPAHNKGMREPEGNGSRGFLWVDAVGGFLICLNDRVVLGQAVPGVGIDIPILGDLSSRHASLVRCGENYVVEPHAMMSLNGRPLSEAAVLHHGDCLGLGSGDRVRIRFRKPHPLSNSACLDMLSGHRTVPLADGIILVGRTCLLGPSEQHHVPCRDWTHEIVLSRGSGGGFRFRSGRRVELNGVRAADAGELPWNTRLSGEDFALTMERGT